MGFNSDSIADMRKRFAVPTQQNEAEDESASTHSDEQRRVKLQSLLEQLKSGDNVQNRKLKTWLTDEEYGTFEQQWEGQKELRSYIEDKPSEVAEYEALLKLAIFLENRANSHSSKRQTEAATNLSNNAQAKYEIALEYLHENLTSNPSLEAWFDRRLDFSAGNAPSLTASAMPRAVTTRSLDKNGDGLMIGKMSKLEVKIDVVERALANL